MFELNVSVKITGSFIRKAVHAVLMILTMMHLT